jgi:hypothetical protein
MTITGEITEIPAQLYHQESSSCSAQRLCLQAAQGVCKTGFGN